MGGFVEFLAVMGGIGAVLVVASIGLWKSGELRDLFNKLPEIDKYVEQLANKYDELEKKLKELLDKLEK